MQCVAVQGNETQYKVMLCNMMSQTTALHCFLFHALFHNPTDDYTLDYDFSAKKDILFRHSSVQLAIIRIIVCSNTIHLNKLYS
jgi:hypothetical protein